MNTRRPGRRVSFAVLLVAAFTAILAGASGALFASCGPFTDFTDPQFCPFVLEIFYLGITTGTTPSTYDPAITVSRIQMAAFLARTVDRTLLRGSRRAALDRFWLPQVSTNLTLTTVGTTPQLVKSDGTDVWVANSGNNTVSRVRGSDGKRLETWTGAAQAFGVLSAMGQIFVTAPLGPGQLYKIDPTQTAGAVTTVSSSLSGGPRGIAFDGTRIWTADSTGAVSLVTPGPTIPWTTTNVATGFNSPKGAVFDGSNIWVTDENAHTLLKLNSGGAILLTVTVGSNPLYPVFDGNNIWVPNGAASSVSVVKASNGAVLATLTGNGQSNSTQAAFDGERILVTGFSSDSVISLWKAADLTPLGSLTTGASTFPAGACSDGVSFWITLNTGFLARY